MDRQFIWDSLEACGLPIGFINAIKMLYVSNKHFLRLHGSLFEGPPRSSAEFAKDVLCLA